MKLIFDKSVPTRQGLTLPRSDVPTRADLDARLLRARPAELPEVSELDVVRHFTGLSRRNFGVDSGFYPLGSCTMKYNPKIAEAVGSLPGFARLHPMLAQLPGGEEHVQGALEVLYEAERFLCEVCGMDAFSSQPMAGANGELTGVLIIAAYHRQKGNTGKDTILIPDSAHGTNPASAAIAGFKVRSLASNDRGEMDLHALQESLAQGDVAGVMLTCPNTLGLFNPDVIEICKAVHAADALTYYDGANLNALLGRCRPGDLGFDIVHVNLHKTFATPHGSGGPGAGPVGVVERLAEFLPVPSVRRREDGGFTLAVDHPRSIGQMAMFYGNFGIVLRAYVYMRMLGRQGVLDVSQNAVLNANYVRHKLRGHYDLPYDRPCMHECVFSAARQAAGGVRAVDIAKALLDRGIHPMTVYFPLTVREAMMIEPTETESRETLDEFIAAMIEIARLAETDPQRLLDAPLSTPVGRLDETRAAREPDLAAPLA